MLVIAYVAGPALVMGVLALAGCWHCLVVLSGVLCLLSLSGILSQFLLPPDVSGLFALFGIFILFYSFPTLVLAIMFYFISKPPLKHPAV